MVICDSGNRVFGGSGSSRIAFPECEAMRRARKHSAKPTLVHFRLYSRVFAFCIPVAHARSPEFLENFQTNESSPRVILSRAFRNLRRSFLRSFSVFFFYRPESSDRRCLSFLFNQILNNSGWRLSKFRDERDA